MSEKESKHSNSEGDALFRQSVGPVQPVKSRRRHQEVRQVSGKARSRRRDEKQVLTDSLALSPAELDVETGDELRFQRPSVSRVRMRELRRGKCFREDEIDLHGCTIVQARAELRDFIVYAQRRGLSCVRVVHGKGRRSGLRGPVIKSGVNNWLRQWDEVLAFCSALPSDGGTGAVYVLLRRR